MTRTEVLMYGPRGEPRKPAVIAMLLEGESVEDIWRKLKISRSYVYSIRKEIKGSGQLAGRNVG
jgi:transposase